MKLWGGRFTRTTDRLVEDFHSSISFDQRLYKEDIAGSIAHARMLAAVGLITPAEGEAIIKGLEEIRADIEAGQVTFDVGAEDIHMNIEKLLTERIGEAGKKLHTARSRNDQVALDLRLYLKEEIPAVKKLLAGLQQVLVDLAAQHLQTIMPGYTHLQKAQPVTLAHHLMAYFEMFYRDQQRLDDCLDRVDVMPLGAGALAGTTLPIDRELVARELGFKAISANSLDAVSDRDFVVEFLAAASLIMMHLSRLAEEVIFWSSEEFGFLELDDAYSTGSSMMPQKKNPDVAELVRGKTGRVYGHLMGMLAVLKGLPLAYNKDLQEDKEALFDTLDTVKGCLMVFTPMLATARFRVERMRADASRGFAAATDVAEYLVRKGLPFREAHAVVGSLVLHCLREGRSFQDLSVEEWQSFSPLFDNDIFGCLEAEACVNGRNLPGGPAPEAVGKAIERAREILAGIQAGLSR
ncbi:argininosuccinate lyase 1 [Moorella thermoacetica]|uniref:Argininosuccinate lyase n=1 Tax=Neomoorella thermoacetica TaxID=1525 RepID=A0A1J5JK88_NEOTH|nr:argininosuccinate lyase [Moorella thermoacetica]OIQ09942.1 argininosuccinate lyase 1 [Moorella thermoacetica]